ncbi:MAG: outer membrane lipoprotein LolB [Halothiobacillaceae bacterium]|nr:MAG: outer membrane lipoprotein LolB [Halothiobacillaceae bacterium]
MAQVVRRFRLWGVALSVASRKRGVRSNIARSLAALGCGGLLMVSGCATSPTVLREPKVNEAAWQQRLSVVGDVVAWRFTGRVGVSNASESWSASIDWQESPAAQEIRVTGPVGQGAAVIKRVADGVTMSLSNGQVYAGRSGEQLLYERLGWRVPVVGLRYWMRGIPAPQSPAQWQLDNDGRALWLEQEGWKITYKGYQRLTPLGVSLPAKLFLEHQEWQVRLVVQEWLMNP